MKTTNKQRKTRSKNRTRMVFESMAVFTGNYWADKMDVYNQFKGWG